MRHECVHRAIFSLCVCVCRSEVSRRGRGPVGWSPLSMAVLLLRFRDEKKRREPKRTPRQMQFKAGYGPCVRGASRPPCCQISSALVSGSSIGELFKWLFLKGAITGSTAARRINIVLGRRCKPRSAAPINGRLHFFCVHPTRFSIFRLLKVFGARNTHGVGFFLSAATAEESGCWCSFVRLGLLSRAHYPNRTHK
jgi:hypothetical protein